MERRWPWKKKSSDKSAIEKSATAAVLESATASLVSPGTIQIQVRACFLSIISTLAQFCESAA